MTAPLDLDAIEASHQHCRNAGYECVDLRLVQRCRAAEAERDALRGDLVTEEQLVEQLQRDLGEAKQRPATSVLGHVVGQMALRANTANARVGALEEGLRALLKHAISDPYAYRNEAVAAARALLEGTPDPPDIHVPADTGIGNPNGDG